MIGVSPEPLSFLAAHQAEESLDSPHTFLQETTSSMCLLTEGSAQGQEAIFKGFGR